MPDSVIGSVIDGRYKVLSRLGSGGMADVYLAEDQQLARKIALKLLYRRFAENPGFVERFKREAQAAAGLQHPNVVSVYDRGAYDGTYYIAMEYVPGRTLKQLIREEAPLEPIRAIEITEQILKAARFAHRHGVIHRDLKPHNVIIGESDQAKVTDFGIARAGASDMTETGSILGTAQYLSPEQAQGHAVSASSDLYSIAVVLYEMLTGRVPFDAEQAVTIAIKHVSEAPTAPTQVNPGVPPELEQVVMWALNKNAADRPADADQFIAALERAKAAIVAGSSGEPTASMAAVGALASVPSAAAASAAAPQVSAAPAILPPPPRAGQANGREDAPPGGAQPPDRRRRRGLWWLVAALLIAALAGGGVAAYLLTRPVLRTVPSVVGDQVGVATAVLTNDGFHVSTTQARSSHPPGYVFRQSPPGGAKAKKGSTVSLTVSAGPGDVTVPPLLGETVAKARQALRQSGLKLGTVTRQHSSTIASGEVISSSPGAGASVPPGTSVNLLVSSGPALVKVPNVVGQTLSAATAELRADGLSVAPPSTQVSSSAKPGEVIRQSPKAGTQVAPGFTVALVLAEAPPKKPATVTVPDVKGQTASAATTALKAAGFQVKQTPKDVSNPAKQGIVLAQSPAAGSTQSKGSTITITVGRYQPTTTTSPSTNPATTTTTTTTGG